MSPRDHRDGFGSFDTVSETIGVAAALRLSLHFGGQRIVVRKAYPDADPVVSIIGREAADLLSNHYAGLHLTIAATRGLKAEALRLIDKGQLTRNEIAAQLHISERRIYRWIAERDMARQPDLFTDQPPLLTGVSR